MPMIGPALCRAADRKGSLVSNFRGMLKRRIGFANLHAHKGAEVTRRRFAVFGTPRPRSLSSLARVSQPAGMLISNGPPGARPRRGRSGRLPPTSIRSQRRGSWSSKPKVRPRGSRGLIAGVEIGIVLLGEIAIDAAHHLLADVARYAERFVGIVQRAFFIASRDMRPSDGVREGRNYSLLIHDAVWLGFFLPFNFRWCVPDRCLENLVAAQSKVRNAPR